MSEQDERIDEIASLMSPEEKDLLQSYLLFKNGSGYLVYEDLRRTFKELENESVLEELEEIPHPYRAYVERGMAMVIRKIDLTMKLAEEIS